MKNLLTILYFCLSATILCAQPTIQWQKTLGGSEFDEAKSIQQTSDGGYIITGRTLSSNGDVVGNHGVFDFWVVKLTATGSIQWQRALGGSNHDWGFSIQQTFDGGYIVAGMTESDDGDVSGKHSGKDAWVVKLNNLGAIEWQKALGGSGWDEAWSIKQTTDGGYIMAGRSSSNDGDVSGNHGGSLDFWVVKLTSIGDIEWQKSLGGSLEDTAINIRQTSDGGFIVIGEAKSDDGDVVGNNGNVDFWVVKLSSTGDIEWQNALGGANLDVGSDLLETVDGYIACGYAGSHNTGDVTGHQGNFDFWIVKLNKNGELAWQKTLGGSNADYIRTIAQTSDGMYIVAGETKSKDGDVMGNNGIEVIWVVKLNQIGEILWKKTLGGTQGEGCFSIQQTSDNGFILGGYAFSNDGDVTGNHGSSDFWVVKLSPETTSTAEIPEAQPATLEIAPNPARHSIFLKTNADELSLNIAITDLLGREVLRKTISNGGSIEVSSLTGGLYQIQGKGQSGKTYFGKLQKE